MRLNEIVKESKKVNEAPMGMLSRAGRGIAAKLGHKKSAGALDTGKTANAVRDEYDTWLGSTGESPSTDNVIAFLKHKGWPTQGALQVLQGGGGPSTQGPMDPNDPNHANPAAGGSAADNTSQAPADQAEKPGMFQRLKQKFGGATPADNAQGTTRIDPSMDEPAADAAPKKRSGGKVSGQVSQTPNAQRKRAARAAKSGTQASPGAGAFGNMANTLGNTQPASTNPQQQDPAAAGRAEKLSKLRANMAPVGIQGKGNKARKRLGQVGKAKQQAGSGSQGVLDLNSIQFEDAVPNNLVDKALLRAVQDARRMGIGIDIHSGGQQAAGSGADNSAADQGQDQDQGGFISNFKQGFNQGSGKGGKPGSADPNAEKKGSLNINQLAQLLPNVDPNQLRRASAVVLQGGKLNQQMLGTLGQAFGEVLKADPQVTMKVMRLLKQVQA